MKVRYLSGAWRDYEQALMWHRQQKTGRASALAKEIGAAVQRMKSDPLSWERVEWGCRRVPVNRFPYSVIFQVRPADDEILIVAVSHASRDQTYWHSRVRDKE